MGNIIAPTYNGAAQTPTPQIKYWGRTLQKDVDYTLSYSNNVNANDNARVTITAKGPNFTGTRTAGFQIKPYSLTNSGAKITGITDLNYRNGDILSQTNLKVTLLNGTELKRNTDYTVSYKNFSTGVAASPTGNPNSNVAYYVVIAGKGNYSGMIDSNSNRFTVIAPGNSSSSGNGSSSGGNTNTSDSSLNQDPVKTSNVTGTWKKSGGKWWFAYDSATQKIQKKAWPSNEWVKIGGKSYHFDKNGYMHSKWYKHTNNKWYWLGSDGAMRQSTWAKISGKWYFLDGNGQMKTGRFSVSNAWYYCDGNGAMYANKWVKANNVWYWATGSGAFKMGWQKVSGKWYYLDPAQQGAMKTGFYTVGVTTYYSNGSGAMLTGWQHLTRDKVTSWYYFNGSGAMQKGKWIQGKYWVESDGRMATSRWVDNGRYYVDSSGKWVPNKKK